MGNEETLLSFKSVHVLFEKYFAASNLSVKKSLRSLCCAKCLDWIDLRKYEERVSGVVDMDFNHKR
jgi:hypothetical protein